MYRKFINITMQHLIDKCVIGFMTVVLMSCSHITYMVYDRDDMSESSEEKTYFEKYSKSHPSSKEKPYKEIYCTPEDKKKGLKPTKITIDALAIPCGRSKIQPLKNRILEIERIVLGIERSPRVDILLGHHLLLLKDGDKVLHKIQVEKEDDPFWKEVVFVKIRKGVYWQDLNNDGHPEFAILPTEMGKAIYRPAYIYSLKEDTFHFYGKGKYIWYKGQHVLLNCPECWEYDLDKCDQCT